MRNNHHDHLYLVAVFQVNFVTQFYLGFIPLWISGTAVHRLMSFLSKSQQCESAEDKLKYWAKPGKYHPLARSLS